MGWYKAGSGKPVALSEFAPDKNVLEPGILLDAVNAQPTISGFSPMANLVGLAPALSGRAVGSFYAYYSNDTATLFAAIDNGAGVSWFALDTSLSAWVPITGPTANPAVPVRFAQFGDDVLAVGNFASPDGVWIAPNKASNFVTIPGSPPNATVIVVAGLQVVVFVGDAWFSSAVGNDTDWVLSLATRADTGPLADAPGPVVAASALFRNIVAFKKNVTYLGQQSFPSAWDWQLISTETGTWSQGCVIQLPDGVAFLGMDDFYVITGYAPQAIPNNVKQWFFRNVDPAYIASTLGWYDSANSLLYWHFVSREAPDPPTCDRFVSYNRSARRWCVGRLDVSSLPYLGIAATSLPTPAVPAIVIDGEFIPKAFSSFPSNMVLTTGYYGEPTRLSQLMRVLPVYNRAPCVQTLTPLCTDVLGQPDKQSEPAALGVDGWFYTRQYERYHKLVLGAQGDCEITAIVPELREGGLWGYGVNVPCPDATLSVESQVNPTDPVTGDPAAPEISATGTTNSGGNLVTVLGGESGAEPDVSARAAAMGNLTGGQKLSATPSLSASATVSGGGGGGCANVVTDFTVPILNPSDTGGNEDDTEIIHSVWRTGTAIAITAPFQGLTGSPAQNARDIPMLDYTLISGMSDTCAPFAGFSNWRIAFDKVPGNIGIFTRGIEMGVLYGGAISGAPISGLCMFMNEASNDLDNFTGLCLLINHVANKTQLVYFQNESLRVGVNPAHVLADSATLPTAGNLVYWFVNFGLSEIVVNVDPGFVQVIDYLGTDPIRQAIIATSPTNDRQAMTNAGLVWVGNGTGPGINAARWYQDQPSQNAYITVANGP